MKKKTFEEKQIEAQKTLKFYKRALKAFDGKPSFYDGSACGVMYHGRTYWGLCGFTDTIKNPIESDEIFFSMSKIIKRSTQVGPVGYFKNNEIRVAFIKRQIKKCERILTIV